MLTKAPAQTTTCDVECRLQAAARAFNANRWVLCDPKVAIAQKLECFAVGHRTVYRNDLRIMDVAENEQKNGARSFLTPTAVVEQPIFY